DRTKLYVEQVADRAMRVGRIADAVKLEVRVAQPRFSRLFGELGALRELNSIGGRLHAVVSDFTRIANGVQKIRRQRRLASGELYGHLAARLDGDRVVEQLLDIFPAQLMNKADLIGIHEARVAHHIAAVGEID